MMNVTWDDFLSSARDARTLLRAVGQRVRHLTGEARLELGEPFSERWSDGGFGVTRFGFTATRDVVAGWDEARCWELGSRICFEGIGYVTIDTGEMVR